MSIIPTNIQEQVKTALSAMEQPVHLIFFTRSQATGDANSMLAQAQELVEDVATLSDKLSLEIVDLDHDPEFSRSYRVENAPAIAILRGGDQPKDYGIRFIGTPSGYEFSTLIEDILLVSQGEPGLGEKTRRELAKLDRPVHIQVFVTPTCGYCPPAVILAHRLALASDLVTADAVESMEFPELANRYQVYGVPRTVINEVIHIEGALPENALMDEFMKVMDENKMAELSKNWLVEA